MYIYICYSNNFSDHYQSLLSLQACFMDCSNLQEKQIDTDTETKKILFKLSSSWNFHFQAGTFTFSTFLRRDILMCGQCVPISCLWFREARWGFLRM